MKNMKMILFPFLLSCFLSISSINATDIKIKGMLRLSGHWPIGYEKMFSISFRNDNELNAPVKGTITVKDEGGQTVFEETVQTPGDIPAYTDGTLTTQTPFIPELEGIYTIMAHVEPVGMNDIDESNNDWEGTLEAFQPFGIPILPGQGLELFQLDFTFPEAQQENSSYGMVFLNWNTIFELTGFTLGYLNIVTASNWIIQNMIYDLSAGYMGLSSLFNLGVQDGTDVDEIEIYAVMSEEPLMTMDYRTIAYYEVGARPYNAQGGVGEQRSTVPAPLPFVIPPFIFGGESMGVFQPGHVSIEQDLNQCAPASVANSLQWLENSQDINVPDDHKPGIRDNTLVGKLDTAMKRPAHGLPPTWLDVVKGKVKYIDSNGLSDDLSIKHKDHKGTPPYLSNDTVKVNNTMSIPNTDTTKSLIDWIIEELEHGEDVELGIAWVNGGSHMVDLIGGGKVLGVPWLAWVHDAYQGYDDNGTPADVSDDKTAMNGGISADSGGVGFSFLNNDTLLCVIMGGDTSRGRIATAMSESKKEATAVDDEVHLMKEYSLDQNYPNPFNPTTMIKYSIPVAAHVSLTVYDVLGKQVVKLVDKVKPAGNHQIEFNAHGLASGIYVYKLKAGNFVDSKKMIYLK